MGYVTHAFSAALTIPAIVGGALKAQVLIPVLTEGSLNVLGVPIVCTPEDVPVLYGKCSWMFWRWRTARDENCT